MISDEKSPSTRSDLSKSGKIATEFDRKTHQIGDLRSPIFFWIDLNKKTSKKNEKCEREETQLKLKGEDEGSRSCVLGVCYGWRAVIGRFGYIVGWESDYRIGRYKSRGKRGLSDQCCVALDGRDGLIRGGPSRLERDPAVSELHVFVWNLNRPSCGTHTLRCDTSRRHALELGIGESVRFEGPMRYIGKWF